MTIVANNIHGDYQLANGYGHDKAKDVLKVVPKLLQDSITTLGVNPKELCPSVNPESRHGSSKAYGN